MFNWLKSKKFGLPHIPIEDIPPMPSVKPPKSSEEIKPRFIEIPFQKINVQSDDVIVFLYPECLSEKGYASLKKTAKEHWPHLENKILILDDGMKIGAVHIEELNVIIRNETGFPIQRKGSPWFDGTNWVIDIIQEDPE